MSAPNRNRSRRRLTLLAVLLLALAACGPGLRGRATPTPLPSPTPLGGGALARVTPRPATEGETGDATAAPDAVAESPGTLPPVLPGTPVNGGGDSAEPPSAVTPLAGGDAPYPGPRATATDADESAPAGSTPTGSPPVGSTPVGATATASPTLPPGTTATPTPTLNPLTPTATAVPGAGVTPTASQTPVTPTATPGGRATPPAFATSTPTPVAGTVPLGDLVTMTFGGFTFQPVAGWNVIVQDATAVIYPPDSDFFTGPNFTLDGVANFGTLSLSQVIADAQSDIVDDGGMVEAPVNIVINGVAGQRFAYTMDVFDSVAGTFAALLTDTHLITIDGYAVPDEWAATTLTQYNAVLNTVKVVPFGTGYIDPDPLLPTLWRVGGPTSYVSGAIIAPEGLALDDAGNRLYVADRLRGIYVFDLDGNQLDVWVDDEWDGLVDVARLPDGNLVATDELSRIFKLSPDGAILQQVGEEGNGNGQFGFTSPLALAVNGSGTVYALDYNEDAGGNTVMRVQAFSSNLVFQSLFNVGSGNDYFPDMAVGPDGSLYLVEFQSGEVRKYSPQGALLATLGAAALAGTNPETLAVDSAGNIYVGITNPPEEPDDPPVIYRLSPSGVLVDTYGQSVTNGVEPWGAGGFYWPEGIVVSADGSRVYVSDWSDAFAYITAFTFD